MKVGNPFAFRPGPVGFWTTIIYLALLVPLLLIHETVPPVPESASIPKGINLSEAWYDLATLTRTHHPYNSRANDKIRDFLLLRIHDILSENGASEPAVTVFNDIVSNVTMTTGGGGIGLGGSASENKPGLGTYFEGTNIYVYIRGKLDEEGAWWDATQSVHDEKRRYGKGGVLVNAHYDSVSTGYGATDDGVGVVTILQLIKYFTAPGHQPQRGIIALLNNGEEDFLWGARAFGKSPLMPFAHTFLNLEGAGAGGRAILFRTSDEEVTSAYAGTTHPFGSVLASDAFSLGLIRSQTDYVVFNGVYGQRGLDLAFYRPRARYHTNQDDLRHTTRSSVWHMLSAALSTMENLTGDTGGKFDGRRGDGDRRKVANGQGHDGVWFDLFGSSLAVFGLRSMFAWSLTLLIAAPLILFLLTYILHKLDRYYYFSNVVKSYEHPDGDPISIGGMKGFFRFPFAFIVAGALVFGSAFLLTKINPLIIYSSEYAVWAMMISLFYFVFWLLMRGASFVRPSALHRGFVHIWLFILGWAILVADTVYEDRFRIASGYAFVFFLSAVFLSLLISMCEQFALPTKQTYREEAQEAEENREHLDTIPNSDALIAPSPGELDSAIHTNDDASLNADAADDLEATETTPLVGGGRGANARTTFASGYRRSVAALTDDDGDEEEESGKEVPYQNEQQWSTHLPSWTWFLQFLLLGPFFIILVAQMGLFMVASVSQTGADGSSLLMPYLLIAGITVFLLLPITPFIHRISHHIPLFLLLVFIGTLIYNLVAFPFSANNRYKVYFQQVVDLDTGNTTVKYAGIEEYVRAIIRELPSAAGKPVTCGENKPRLGSTLCTYDGSAVPPRVASDLPDGVPPEIDYHRLVLLNVTRAPDGSNKAQFDINARDSKACFLRFRRPVSGFQVVGGSAHDDRFGQFPDAGVDEIKLWRRDWTTPWTVHVEWESQQNASSGGGGGGAGGPAAGPPAAGGGPGSDEVALRSAGLEGSVRCIWSDANEPGTIPALDEALQYAPAWVAITKLAEGLVEGSKSFMV